MGNNTPDLSDVTAGALKENNWGNLLMNNTIIVVLILAILVVIFIVSVLLPLIKEYEYIKMEIGRTSGNEQLYWQKKMRHLWLKRIPIIRWFFKSKKKRR